MGGDGNLLAMTRQEAIAEVARLKRELEGRAATPAAPGGVVGSLPHPYYRRVERICEELGMAHEELCVGLLVSLLADPQLEDLRLSIMARDALNRQGCGSRWWEI